MQPYIAVVDDDASVCKAFGRLLRSAKFQVSTFRSGEEFLLSLPHRVPVCVVLDIHMRGLSGFDVQARLAGDAAHDIAVIAVTAHDSPETRQRALAGGAAAYIVKPIDADLLLGAIHDAIAKRAP
jgi:FixJ family two-component response regulator